MMKYTQNRKQFKARPVRRRLLPGGPLPSIDELKRIVRERDTSLEKDLGPDGIWVPHADLKNIMSCLFALIWLEEPRGKIFIVKAEELIKKYQPNA